MSENQANRPVPKPLALIMCDSVTIDPATKNFTLVGTFDHIVAPLFPAPIKLGIYAVLAGCHGKHSLQLVVVFSGQGSDDADIGALPIKVETYDPLEAVQVKADIIGSLAKPGVYFVQLRDESGTCLIERRLIAHLPKSSVQGPPA